MGMTRELRLWFYGLLILANLVVGLASAWSFVRGAGPILFGFSLAFLVLAAGFGWRFTQTKRMPDDNLGLARPNPLSDPATRSRRLWARATWVASCAGLCIATSWYTLVKIDYFRNPVGLVLVALSLFLVVLGALGGVELLKVWREPTVS